MALELPIKPKSKVGYPVMFNIGASVEAVRIDKLVTAEAHKRDVPKARMIRAMLMYVLKEMELWED
ncbi:MAG: hypothetical protein ACYSWU_18245 [Planctomycetota bacterium]|jgi:hypothetical protein